MGWEKRKKKEIIITAQALTGEERNEGNKEKIFKMKISQFH